MRNRYPGICYSCNLPVAKGDGHFEKNRRPKPGQPKWWTVHAKCAIASKEANIHRLLASEKEPSRGE